MKLMIVESPAKIKKIKSCLGNEWVIKASCGHIRDLPDDELGFKSPDFIPNYTIMKDKKKIISDLKKHSKNSDVIYIATDADREGEAIAFHLRETLNITNYKRITFCEINKEAISKAINNYRSIDEDLVKAYEARRVLDRIIGYYVSPILSKKSHTALSAGRVQSVCLKIIVMREKVINDFIAKPYYELSISLKSGINAHLEINDWTSDNHIYNQETIKLLGKTNKIIVKKISTEEKKDYPRSPFISSTLQQSAFKLFSFSPKKTMELAQALHVKGAITYHRTDNPNLSADGFTSVKNWIIKQGLEYSETQKVYKSKGSAQEAHEGIRPSDINISEVGDDKEMIMLYQLIRERTIASVMKPAIDEITTCIFESINTFKVDNVGKKAIFTASAVIIKENNWRKYVAIEAKDRKEKLISDMPAVDQSYDCSATVENKKTKTPKRFHEGDLVKVLERLEIGRPSTYASIIENIKKRKYIKFTKQKVKLISPTEKGNAVVEALKPMSFMNIDYTKITEDYLDKIAAGEGDYKYLVKKVHETVSNEQNLIEIPILAVTEQCPGCHKTLKQIKKRGRDAFWVHIDSSAAGDCKKFITDKENKPFLKNTKIKLS